jgi:phage recombination protein Bet
LNELVPFIPKPLEFTSDALRNIRMLVPKDATADEFDRFISVCKFKGLDPRAGHIYLTIYNADKPEKRQVVTVISEQGYLTAANRCRDLAGKLIYRADEKTPRFTYDPSIKGPTNPLGIVSCTVSCYKLYDDGWHEAPAEVFWDERVPTTNEWVFDKAIGKKVKTDNLIIPAGKSGWIKQPRNMIAKCARVAAVRYAFPDQFGGLYSMEEADAIEAGKIIDVSATVVMEEARQAERLKAIGHGEAILLGFDSPDIVPVPLGQVHDRMEEYFGRHPDAAQIKSFVSRNRHAIREFNALRPGEWLDLKRKFVDAAAEEMKRREAANGEGKAPAAGD